MVQASVTLWQAIVVCSVGVFNKRMATVQVTGNITLSSEALLDACGQLDVVELERLHSGLGELIKQRNSELLRPSSGLSVEGEKALAEDAVEGMTLPIVEKFIPASITLDGDSFSF